MKRPTLTIAALGLIAMLAGCGRPPPPPPATQPPTPSETLLSQWTLRPAAQVADRGDTLSTPGYDDSTWLPVTVPSTELLP